MSDAIWYVRWRLANYFMLAALTVCPKGPAHTLLVDYLNDYSSEIYAAIAKARGGGAK